ncbi:MAG TPA: hypothetical protein VMW79_06045 [Anaerolineae bacterium]|nr:hypothetical protein [Anaerolineae bacterium]HUW96005.1 hypothetical protein [Anaerolineae bacterium]
MPENSTPNANGWRPVFLAALRNSANVRAATQAAGIDRTTAYKARNRSQEFRRQWEEAMEDACDLLEAEAFRRAMASSDWLLRMLLSAHRPERFRDTTRHELTGKDGDRLAFTLKLGELNDNGN